MSFKDQVAMDIQGVFINPLEFADKHTIDGVTDVDCVLDSDVFAERTGLDQAYEYDGVFVTDKMLYIAESFFSQRPVEGQEMQVDDDYYYVKKVGAQMGVLEITLRQNSS